MPNTLQNDLAEYGFVRVMVSLNGIGLFVRPEYHLVNALLIVDTEKVPYPDHSDLELLRQKVRGWIGEGSERGDGPDVHILTVIRSGDTKRNRDLAQDEQMVWFADPFEHKLFVYENQVSDFYGIFEVLDRAARQDLLGESANLMQETAESAKHPRALVDLKSFPFMTAGIVILNLAVLLICEFAPINLREAGAVGCGYLLGKGEYYRLLTSLFLHAGVNHLFGNMVLLGYAGKYLEERIGHIAFLILYFGSGVIGSVFSMGADLLVFHDNHSSIGASGAVFGLIGGMIIFTLLNGGWSGTINPRRIAAVAVLMLYSGFSDPSIDNAAHLGGLVGGMLVMLILWLFRAGRRRRQNEN